MIQRKYWKKGMVTAGFLLLAACGNKDGDEIMPSPGNTQEPQVTQAAENLTTPSPSVTDEPGVVPPDAPTQGEDDIEQGGVITENENEKGVAVQDEITGLLSYGGVNYEITGDDTMSIVDYYDIEMTKLVIPDELEYEGKTYRVRRLRKMFLHIFTILHPWRSEEISK